jgi:hypothetical protein
LFQLQSTSNQPPEPGECELSGAANASETIHAIQDFSSTAVTTATLLAPRLRATVPAASTISPRTGTISAVW